MDVYGNDYSSMIQDQIGVMDQSLHDQTMTEQLVTGLYKKLGLKASIHREEHAQFISQGWNGLAEDYEKYEPSLAWMCYWMSLGKYLLDEIDYQKDSYARDVERILYIARDSQDLEGGFGGNNGHMAHLATTYAFVNSLILLGEERGYQIINRKNMLKWLRQLKQPNGSFRMHVNGEIDIRGSYCAITIAKICNILTEDLVENVAEFIASCQTYEGGFGSLPGLEAHGGYTFCGLATLDLIDKLSIIDESRLLKWITNRQMSVEGGFQGRTNKLVDSCYSFWQGSSFSIIARLLQIKCQAFKEIQDSYLFDREALQRYTFIIGQAPLGGFLNRPNNSADFYHTCYALSGLSTAQHTFEWDSQTKEYLMKTRFDFIGDEDNLLNPIHPIYNVNPFNLRQAIEYFSLQPKIE